MVWLPLPELGCPFAMFGKKIKVIPSRNLGSVFDPSALRPNSPCPVANAPQRLCGNSAAGRNLHVQQKDPSGSSASFWCVLAASWLPLWVQEQVALFLPFNSLSASSFHSR